MTYTKKCINFIKFQSLNQRQFSTFLSELANILARPIILLQKLFNITYFENSQKFAYETISMFGSTYRCEQLLQL